MSKSRKRCSHASVRVWHVADKATDIERLDELLSSTEHEKMAALAMHDEMQVLLDRERQDKVSIIRANTEQASRTWCGGALVGLGAG